MTSPKIPELVLPGGDLHRVRIAFLYGADAVYVGLDKYSLRKAEIRFTIAEIGKAISLAHSLGKKLYVTFNIFAHNANLKTIENDMKRITAFAPDAFIISDPGIVAIAKKVAPKVAIHLSTQANTVNSESVKFWAAQGIKRIVLARELTLKEITAIKKAAPKVELEVFAHGAMCISYSGRCLMSAVLTGRSANLGACTQPCRWPYNLYLEDATRPGEMMKMEEDAQGTYLMSSKDLCTIEHIDKLAKAGASALKIEGRNKTDFYVATVASAYSRALKLFAENKFNTKTKKELMVELESLTRRGYTTGFLFGDAQNGETFPGRQPILGKRYLGYISKFHKDTWSTVAVKNKIESGKEYEILTPNGVEKFKIIKIKDGSKVVPEANPGQKDKKVIVKSSIPLPCDSFIHELK